MKSIGEQRKKQSIGPKYQPCKTSHLPPLGMHPQGIPPLTPCHGFLWSMWLVPAGGRCSHWQAWAGRLISVIAFTTFHPSHSHGCIHVKTGLPPHSRPVECFRNQPFLSGRTDRPQTPSLAPKRGSHEWCASEVHTSPRGVHGFPASFRGGVQQTHH